MFKGKDNRQSNELAGLPVHQSDSGTGSSSSGEQALQPSGRLADPLAIRPGREVSSIEGDGSGDDDDDDEDDYDERKEKLRHGPATHRSGCREG